MAEFGSQETTDQKRLVRGEHWLAARTFLRARDHSHNKRWLVLMMAGGSPAGEIGLIRELMPKAHIVAVDRDESCVRAAAVAGSTEALRCDLFSGMYRDPPRAACNPAWCSRPGAHGLEHGTPGPWRATPELSERPRFDVISLDVCGLATPELKQLVSVYGAMCRPGVLILTFAYGRDVTEVYVEQAHKYPEHAQRLTAAGIPPHIAGRLLYLFPGARSEGLKSVLMYQGHEMPMLSAMVHRGTRPLTATRVEPGDFELAVSMPDPSLLYDCPTERILALRRSHAAIRAAHTRTAKALASRG